MRSFLFSVTLFAVLATGGITYAFPGQVPPGTAAAEYYSDTGEIIISVNEVVSWFIESDSLSLTGDAPMYLPLGGGVLDEKDAFIAEVTEFIPMTYSNLNIGSVAALGLPTDDLTIRWKPENGQPFQTLPLTYLSSPPPGNAPPTAVLGGPFEIGLANDPLSILLDADNSIDDGLAGTLSYKWDLDDDGTFEVDTGIVSTYEVADVTSTFGGVGSYPVAVEIFDGEFFDVASTVVDLVPDTTPMPLGPGPAPSGTAIAAYDPATGRIIVSVNDVINWFVKSDSLSLTGETEMNLPAGGGLAGGNDGAVGETTGFFPMTYTNVDLGNVAATGLPLSDLTVSWNPGLGQQLITQPVTLLIIPVPEPTGLVLATLGLTFFAATRRRRNVV